MLDVLIRNGWVADGTGSPPFLGDVAIEDGKIVEVGRLGEQATATRVIDASGKVVCPGFVDPHSHSDFSLLANPTAESTIRQGVTTEIVGNCGASYAPVTDFSRVYQTEHLHTFGFDGPLIPWSTFGEHLDFISKVGHSPNLAWFVGHNAIRHGRGRLRPEPLRRAGGARWTASCARRWRRARSACRRGSSSTRGARRRRRSSCA